MDSSKSGICVPVCSRTISELESALFQAKGLAEIIELRLDCLNDFQFSDLNRIAELIRKINSQVILTFRPTQQGGQLALDRTTRESFWRRCISIFRKELFDIELDLLHDADVSLAQLDWHRVICSHHDFAGVPTNLGEIYERMLQTPARYLKIAVAAADSVDCLPIFALLKRAKRDGRIMIGIAMGEAGLATRILGPSQESHWTYAAVDPTATTAPGQIEASTLQHVYHVNQITTKTQIMGLVGSPVGHSISPYVHNAAFGAAGVDAVYIPFEVHDTRPFLERMIQPRTREIEWNLRGLSVTAPHKTDVIEFLDSVDPVAVEIGAVNTIVIEGEQLHGYNTDAGAVLKPVLESIGSLRDVRCALIGAGGVARTTLWRLKKEGAAVTVFARDERMGNELAAVFGASYQKLAGARFRDFDLVINATPLGMMGAHEQETPAISAELHGARLAYDLVYNPIETLFLREAREAGCETLSGLSMFLLQAAEQFRLWTNLEAPIAIMQTAAQRALGTFEQGRCKVESNRKPEPKP